MRKSGICYVVSDTCMSFSEYDVAAVGMNGHTVRFSFVESALPPFCEWKEWPVQPFSLHHSAVHIEYADLLTGSGLYGVFAMMCSEYAVVCNHHRCYIECVAVERYERNVAKRMVFASACRTDVCYPQFVAFGMYMLYGESCGFGEIVILLFADDMQYAAEFTFHSRGERVAVANYSIWHAMCGRIVFFCSGITAYQIWGV